MDACPWCASRSLAAWREGRDRQYRLSEQRFLYARCRDCGLLFLSVRPVEAEIAAFYPHHYGPYHNPATTDETTGTPRRRTSKRLRLLRRALGKLNSAFERPWPDPVATRLAAFYQPASPGAKLLDFGCGSSLFLDRARANGWQTIGMDFSPEVVESVRAQGHRCLLATTESWRQIADGSLDLVRLHHVLEHVYRPAETLAEVVRTLRPGARIHIGLPNPEGISSRLFRSYWFGLECPRHVLLYRPSFVVAMLQDLGFQDVTVIQESVTKDFARSWAYFRHEMGWVGDEAIAASMSGPLVAGLVLPLRLLTRVGLADRFHVLARLAEDPG